MSDLRWLFGASALFGFAQAVRIGFQFALAIVLTRMLTPNDYGLFSNFVALSTFVFPFACLKPDIAVARAWSAGGGGTAPAYVGTAMIVVVMTSLLTAVLLYLLRAPITSISHLPPDSLVMASIYCLGYGWLMISLAVLQMQKAVVMHGAVRTLDGVSNFLLIVVLVFTTTWGWRAAAIGQATSIFLLGGLVGFALVRKGFIRLTFDPAAARNFVAMSLPLVPHYLGAALIGLVDRFFITAHFGPAAAGTYAVAYQISATIWLFGNVFQQAWMPWVFDRLNDGGAAAHRAVRLAMAMAGGTIALVSLAIGLVTPSFVPLLFGDSHAAAAGYIPLMCAGFYLSALQLMFNTLMYHRGRTGLVASSAIAGGVTNVGLNALLVPNMGPQGAALAMFISSFVSISLLLLFMKFHGQRS